MNTHTRSLPTGGQLHTDFRLRVRSETSAVKINCLLIYWMPANVTRGAKEVAEPPDTANPSLPNRSLAGCCAPVTQSDKKKKPE